MMRAHFAFTTDLNLRGTRGSFRASEDTDLIVDGEVACRRVEFDGHSK